MYRIVHTGADPVPLDFNLPRRTDSVADALCPDPRPHDPIPVSDLDTRALLSEAGVPAHGLREVLASWPASGL